MLGQPVEYLWHQDADLKGVDCVIVPGGFSYGDYLRCGAIARFSPVMSAVQEFAAKGGLVLGICNGFQVLCEAHLLPGALVRNDGQRFVCKHVYLRTENAETPFTNTLTAGPDPAHSGRARRRQVCLRRRHARELQARQTASSSATADGGCNPLANPKRSRDNIAGIANAGFNVLGLMPHPERAADPALGSARRPRSLFESLLRYWRLSLTLPGSKERVAA